MKDKELKFTRSRNRYLAGICGGVAEGMGWNAFLVRIGYIGLTIITGFLPGIIFYLVMWLVMPEQENSNGGN